MSRPAPLRVLVVEDEALLAFALQEELEEAGHEVVGRAATSAEAIGLARQARPDLALVDVHLLDGPTGVEAGRAIGEAGTVVLFMTANVKRIPADFAGAAGVIAKPYSASGLASALAFVGAALDGGATPPPPWSLQLAPHLRPAEDGRMRLRPP
ncbi:response regulator [Rubellimicrobium sp. CFH 75288]|uniref:response regulator n=1 Tax=Rubellimicrobium sp. CFH 75288 TaxID=2697034 RepID=UPI001412E92A|nr:response regulator [Rubellimicrobium sp. CFH 75288]NAZ38150.1 response regulator [Rubellimicrobium sp. CFH 75288]